MTATMLQSEELESSFAELASVGRKPTLQLLDAPGRVGEQAEVESSDVLHARRLADRFPDSPTALSRLAQALLVEGRVEEAVTVAETVAELAAKHPDPHALLGAAYVLLRAGRPELAEAAVEGRTDDGARVLRARCALARDDRDVALRHLDGASTYDAVALRGSILMELSRFPEAVHALRQALELGPVTSDIMLNLAQAHDALGARKSALRAAVVATGLSPLRIDAATTLAFLRLEAGDSDGALAELERVQGLRPTSIRPPLSIATLRFSLGEHTQALREMRRLVTRSDSRYWRADSRERAQVETVTTLSRLRVGDLSAKPAISRLMRVWAESEFATETAGRSAVFSTTRRTDAAKIRPLIERFERAVPARRSHWALYHLAVLEGRYDEALEEAREWIAGEPYNHLAVASAMQLVGEARRDPAGAVEIGRAFRRRAQKNTDIVNSLAYYLILAGELDEAAQLLASPVPQTPIVTATRGLLTLYQGHIDEGRALYEDASRQAASRPNGGPLGDLILLRMGFALRALGEPLPKLPDANAWHDEVNFALWVRYHGFSL